MTRWELVRFFLLGGFNLEVQVPADPFEFPPWSETMSFHLRVRIPDGLRVSGPPECLPERLFENTNVIRFASYDANNAYVYFSRADMLQLLANRDSADAEFERLTKRLVARVIEIERRKLPEGSMADLMRRGIRYVYDGLREAIEQVRQKFRVPKIVVRLRLTKGIGILLILLWVVTLLNGMGIPFGLFTFDS